MRDVGEVLGLIGPNGAGRGTLIKMLTALLPPTSHRGIASGASPVDAPPAYRHYCNNPRGRFPHVPRCYGYWHKAPAAP